MTTGSVLAQFTITLSQAVSEQVAVEWHTADGTALAGVDYASAKGIALFAPGETSKTADILVYGRAVGSEDRSFFVEMLPPVNAILGASIGECIIHVDTAGSAPVTQIIVPTGPRGLQGDSAYQAWLDLGNTGTEEDFINSLKPSAEEIAEEVAPILNVGNSPLTAADTSELSNPDNMTVSELARRVAYVGATKVATVVLGVGDNLISTSDLAGDAIDFSSFGLAVRIMRGGSILSPEWSPERDGRLLVKAAAAGDVLYVCDYDMMSKHAFHKAVSGDGGAGHVGGLAKPVTWSGFAGGADPTGTTSSDAAFAAAEGDVHIPEGNYNIDSQPTITANFDASGYAELPSSLNYCPSGAHPDKGNVRVRKYWGRQFIGAAANGNGKYDGTTTSGKGPGWAERDAQFAVASADGLIAIFGNSKSSDTPAYHAAPSCMGVGGGIINDKVGALGWALYGDVRREAGAGSSFGLELAVKNRGSDNTRRAYTKSYGACGIWLAGGGDPSYQGAPLNPSNFAIAIGKNSHTWNRGIVFDSDGITGTDGLTGTGTAIEMAKGHIIQWSTPTNQPGLSLYSTIDDSARGINAVFANSQLTFTSSSGKPIYRASYAAGSVNYLELNATTTGQGVRVLAQGDDTDVSLRLEAKGAGEVNTKGNLAPLTGNAYLCGTSAKPWAGGFTQAALTVTSDERCKTTPLNITDAMLDAAAEVEWVLFQYLDRVEEKGGDGARWHFGAIAQRFVEAFEKHELDPFSFAFICYDEWEDQYVKVQTNEGETVTKTRTVSQPVMVTTTREVLVDEVLEDGTKIKKAIREEYQAPKLNRVYIFNKDGSPRLDGSGVRAFLMEPVMEDIIEEYTEPAPPEYVDVLETSAGSRYGIRYDQAIILKQKQIERDHGREIADLKVRIEALEGKA